jgi:hypothetical protein
MMNGKNEEVVVGWYKVLSKNLTKKTEENYINL